MKIIQIKTGVIEIPPKGWGAVEKIIWEYLQNLNLMGWECQLKWADEVENNPDQIVHVHMANLANLLYDRGIPYVFSLHDHHVEYYGKDSPCYKENYKAIKNSKLTFVHAKHLIEYFDNLPQIVYLPHAVNTEEYKFKDHSEEVRKRKHKLVMMANNGVGGDPLKDRKGFLLGISAAKLLDLEIAIICPSKGNREFFNHWNPQYEKLSIFYDLDKYQSIEKLNEYDIFLHPSNLEAGHPNLTILESISMGIPVVGTLDGVDIKGMVKIDLDLGSLIGGIRKAINKYDTLVQLCENYRDEYSWKMIVSKMLQEYKSYFNISEKDQLIENYTGVKINHQDKKGGSRGFLSHFKDGGAFFKGSFFSEGNTIYFKNRRTGEILYHSDGGKWPGFWSKIPSQEIFVDWEILVKSGNKILYKDQLELKNKRILVVINNYSIESIKDHLIRFKLKTESFITVKHTGSYYDGICFDPDADPEEFYFTLNDSQLINYFELSYKLPEKNLFILNTNALGDTIGFLPWAQEWAKVNNKIIDVEIKFKEIFDNKDYPNLNIYSREDRLNIKEYTNISKFDYIYDKPLMEGYSYQMELEYKELRPKLKKVNRERPIKSKYICFTMHSTAQCKYWNYPNGWDILCRNLRKLGLTPVCIDQHEVFGIEGCWNTVPSSSVKRLGISLYEMINYLEHCEFFIGVSSGVSWMAWAAGKKVIMISGVTEPENEFMEDNIRIHNDSVCNGCFNKTLHWRFNPSDWLWCPNYSKTSRQFECSSTITPEEIITQIKNNMLI